MDNRSAATPKQNEASPKAPQWLSDLSTTSNQCGFFISDSDFAIQHTERGNDILYVSFDNLSGPRSGTRMRDPWGYGLAAKCGWSHLGVLAFREHWFRSEQLFSRLRMLADQNFFSRFRKVVFSGTSMGGYAACAFSSLVHESTVIAFSPQSTLKPEIIRWDKRYPSGSRADWTGEFTDAAVELRSAYRAWIVFDPNVEQDRLHAERLKGPNVTLLQARYSNHFSAHFLRQVGILSRFTQECVGDTMTPAKFYQLYRNGRERRDYLLGVIEKARDHRSTELKKLLATALRKRNRPALAMQMDKIAAGKA